MTDGLADVADRLYGLPLSEFTPARDEVAKAHRTTDRAFSDAVRALRKPSTAAWVVNLLVRRDPGQVDQVLAVGAALREAQATLAADELRALTRQRRQLTAAVTQRARTVALEHGQRVTQAVADQVEATLTAAMIDEGAAAAVRSGLLVAPLAATGVEAVDLSAAVALPELVDFTPSPLAEPVPGRPELHVVPDPDAEEKRRAAARAELESASEELSTAADAVRTAEEELASLEARSLQLQSEIEELRRRLATLEADQEEVDAHLGDAGDALRDARTDLAAATSARDRAQAALDRL
ncbi:hypothetical protein [Nocardioides daejeonensis]|uniref:hypothetical protein n=1 Tax=Nocardioides daejeonensis TaxID=1046556 RepID=UPI000D7441C2|nr:hypothetical protein [Nocardioides daejeonensis]